jgi:hypothetical protein
MALRRPDGLHVEWSGDLGDRQFWYDGASVTVYDPATPLYAREPAPWGIDGMLDRLVPQLNFSPPLAVFPYEGVYRSIPRHVQFGVYLGLNDADGRSCRTLAFVEHDTDWQIWIDVGRQRTPCKLVITYKTIPVQPQFTAVFTGWDFSLRIAAPVFKPTLPTGTQKIPFRTVAVAEKRSGRCRCTTYFTFCGAYYRPFYSGSSVIYQVEANLTPGRAV